MEGSKYDLGLEDASAEPLVPILGSKYKAQERLEQNVNPLQDIVSNMIDDIKTVNTHA